MATVQAHNAGDADAFVLQFLPECKGFFVDGGLLQPFDAQQVKAGFAAGMRSDLQVSDLDILVDGQVATIAGYVSGTWRWPNGTRSEGTWRVTETRVKRDGGWKVLRYHFSPSEVHAAQGVVARLHKAVADKDVDGVVACYGPTYHRGGRMPGDANDVTRWRSGEFVTSREAMEERLEGWFEPGNFSYSCQLEFLHAVINPNPGQTASTATAVVATRETGSSVSGESQGSWEGITNVWWLARFDDGWKIVGSLHGVGDLP